MATRITKKELEAKVEELEKRLKEMEEYAKRLKAEYENFREEVAREKQEIIKNASEYIVSKLIPILDDFERALKHAKNDETFVKGVEIIYKRLMNILENEGLSRIEIGEKFNPFEHEAVEKIETEDVEEYTILEKIENGYKFHGRVIKPAKVKVAIKPRK
ncbi:MAG TPA: nucleotide exchange factor GrpE [Thermotoga sp.]|nr:nucleotide exchange factor GrpE [Thermotoga sp.]